jgi:predicted nucleic acid-binding protein
VNIYLETSAAAKLLLQESESAALAAHLDEVTQHVGFVVVSSFLLETELRRLATRAEVPQASVSDVLDGVELVEPDRSLFHEAGLLPGKHLRSLNALHVATALRMEATQFVAYDIRQCEAATSVGLRTVSPA